jgi:hypothetical protein
VNQSNKSLLVGVISDTHGLMRPQALDALRGSDLIVHAGDVGRPEVLDALRALAPVHAVRGNVDKASWAAQLPMTALVEVGGHLLYVLHIIDALDLDPPTAGFAAVIFGHSHQPSIETRNGVLWLNPGSAGPRRFDLPVSVARLRVSESGLMSELVTLHV